MTDRAATPLYPLVVGFSQVSLPFSPSAQVIVVGSDECSFVFREACCKPSRCILVTTSRCCHFLLDHLLRKDRAHCILLRGAGTVLNRWSTSLHVGALVTLMAGVHYMYTLVYWVQV